MTPDDLDDLDATFGHHHRPPWPWWWLAIGIVTCLVALAFILFWRR
jgi:hypothetical protein